MSEPKGVRFEGKDEDWVKYKHVLEDEGKTVGSEITSIVMDKIGVAQLKEDKDMATASAHQDRLRDKLLLTDLSKVIIQGEYHVIISDISFIQAAGHDLSMRVKGAVSNAVWTYWVRRWTVARGKPEHQAQVFYCEKKMPKFDEVIDNINITYTINIPTITLSDLREKDIGQVVQFDCLIIGPTPKKLDIETGKYIQQVLIQEPEGTSKNNNPTMIMSLLHGEQTNDIASGMRKRFVGIYTVAAPKEGLKDTKDKTLIIDAIKVTDLEEKAEVTLSPYEIEATKEQAEQHEEGYMKALIDSFCPKILGRELEKKAIYLSLLGGSDIEGYRKESHLMLVGEADTGKSEMVKFANEVANKSSIIDGSNSTGVGILFALDEYDKIKILRQGAMILNNGGHLIVDEYDKMPKPEQKKLNQAMEQQRATYNKGGHTGNAECKTTVIASCNPEAERWNENKTLIDNLPFDASTISRFDLMIRLRHQTHENEIRAKMLHIARRKRGEADHVATPQWVAGLLNYQRKLKPVFTAESEKLLIDRFVEFTQIEQESGALQIQTRQMEGIQRICEAWAKMLFKKEIDVKIVQDVIKFYQECMATLGMNVEKGISQMDLRGHSTNKDTYFQDVFRSIEDEEGHVSITELAESLQENPGMFNSDHSVQSYVEKRKVSGYLFEPKLGILKRQ